MSLIIFPKAFNVGFAQKDSTLLENETSVSTLVETHPVVSAVNPDPNAVPSNRQDTGLQHNKETVPVADEHISIQL